MPTPFDNFDLRDHFKNGEPSGSLFELEAPTNAGGGLSGTPPFLSAIGAIAYISQSSLRNALDASKAAEVEITRAFESLDETGRYCLSAWLETAAKTWNRLASIHVKPFTPYEERKGAEPPPRREKKREYMTLEEMEDLL